MGKLVRDKHSRLLRKSVNYGRNKFYSTGPWYNIGLEPAKEESALSCSTQVGFTICFRLNFNISSWLVTRVGFGVCSRVCSGVCSRDGSGGYALGKSLGVCSRVDSGGML